VFQDVLETEVYRFCMGVGTLYQPTKVQMTQFIVVLPIEDINFSIE